MAFDGITIAKKINELKFESEFPYFIFVTSHDELVFEALNSIPYSFIRKSDVNNEIVEIITNNIPIKKIFRFMNY